jgi:tetratricopeptide (TPR) repeat protein
MKKITFLKIFLCVMGIVMVVAFCSKLIGQKPDSQNFEDIITRLINKGQYKEAADLMNKTVIKSQDDIEIRINVAWINAFNQRYNDALEITDELIKIEPKYQELYYLRGFIYQKVPNYQKAIINLKQSINLNPRDIKSYNTLAEVYQEQENFNDAIYYFSQASALQPENYVYYLNLANIYFKKNDFKKAVEQAQKAYQYAPEPEKEKVSDILENIKLSAILGQNH